MYVHGIAEKKFPSEYRRHNKRKDHGQDDPQRGAEPALQGALRLQDHRGKGRGPQLQGEGEAGKSLVFKLYIYLAASRSSQIEKVVVGSPAEEAGLKEKDFLVSVQGQVSMQGLAQGMYLFFLNPVFLPPGNFRLQTQGGKGIEVLYQKDYSTALL